MMFPMYLSTLPSIYKPIPTFYSSQYNLLTDLQILWDIAEMLSSYPSFMSTFNYRLLHEDFPNKSSTHWSLLLLKFNNNDLLCHSLKYWIVVLYFFIVPLIFKIHNEHMLHVSHCVNTKMVILKELTFNETRHIHRTKNTQQYKVSTYTWSS